MEDYTGTYRTLLSLFDYTGTWSEPFYKAGWNVIQWDIQIAEFMDINMLDSAGTALDQFQDVDGIIAAVPCTDFACSGARWFKAKDESGQTEESIELVRQVMRLVDLFEPTDLDYEGTFFWAIENPVGRLQKLTGLPVQHYFQPYEFAGWLDISKKDLKELDRIRAKNGIGITPEEADLILRTNTYTKKTGLWGSFNHPEKKPIEPVKGSPQGSVMQRFGGKSEKTKNIRSVTPEGFAKAFYEANKNKVWVSEDIINEPDEIEEEIEIETEKKREMKYKIKGLIDSGLDITKLPKENQEDIQTIATLSDNYTSDNATAKELDSLLVSDLEAEGLAKVVPTAKDQKPAAKKTDKSGPAYLYAQTVSGEGYSDPGFEVYTSKEGAEKERDKFLKQIEESGVGKADTENPLDVEVSWGADYERIQIIPLDFPEKYFIVKYTEPNEVKIVEKYDKKGSADLALDMLVTTAEWEDEDILEDEGWEKGQQSFGEHGSDGKGSEGFLWYGVFANPSTGGVIKNKKYDPTKHPLYEDSKGKQYHQVHAPSKDVPGTYIEKGVAVFIDENGNFRPSETEKSKKGSKSFKAGELSPVGSGDKNPALVIGDFYKTKGKAGDLSSGEVFKVISYGSKSEVNVATKSDSFTSAKVSVSRTVLDKAGFEKSTKPTTKKPAPKKATGFHNKSLEAFIKDLKVTQLMGVQWLEEKGKDKPWVITLASKSFSYSNMKDRNEDAVRAESIVKSRQAELKKDKKPAPSKGKELSETSLSKELTGKKIYFLSDEKNWIQGTIIDVIPRYKNEKDAWRIEFYPTGGKSALDKPIVSDVLSSEQIEKVIAGEEVKGYTIKKPKAKVISDFEKAAKEIDECLEKSKTERALDAKDKNKPPKKQPKTVFTDKTESFKNSMESIAKSQKPDKATEIRKIIDEAERKIKKILFS